METSGRFILFLLLFCVSTDAFYVEDLDPAILDTSDIITYKKTNSANSVCCYSYFVVRCGQVMINEKLLGKENLKLPGGISVQFKEYISDNQHHFYYEGNGSTLIITTNSTKPGSRYVHGHARLSTGLNFVIEYCGGDVSVFKEINHGFGAGYDAINENISPRYDLSTDDNHTTVQYSAKIYYTQEMEDSTPDLMGYINQVVAETNQGYKNSKIPLTLKVHCVEKATLKNVDFFEATIAFRMIEHFKIMKSSVKELLGSADVAVLIANSFYNCGAGFENGIYGDSVILVVQKSCAVGYYSFGQGIGINMGLHQGMQLNHPFQINNGNLILNEYRTIMAEHAFWYGTRINYYSNPNVTFNGKPTGTQTANNAHVLRKNRFYLASVGNENKECKSETELMKKLKFLNVTAEFVLNHFNYYSYRHIGKDFKTCPIFKLDDDLYHSIRMESGQIGKCRDTCKSPQCKGQWMWREIDWKYGSFGMCYHLGSTPYNDKYYADLSYYSRVYNCKPKPSCQMTESSGSVRTRFGITACNDSRELYKDCSSAPFCKYEENEWKNGTCHIDKTLNWVKGFTGTPCA